MSQVQEFQLILHYIHAEGISLSESFQVTIIIEKLSSSWKNHLINEVFRNELVLCCFWSQLYQQSWIVVGWHWCYKICMCWENDVFHLKKWMEKTYTWKTYQPLKYWMLERSYWRWSLKSLLLSTMYYMLLKLERTYCMANYWVKKMIKGENTKHYLVNSISKMVLLTKLLFFIHRNKMTLQTRTNVKRNDECHVEKFRSPSELVEGRQF